MGYAERANAHNNIPVIGQPFAITKLYLPACVELTCNCGGAETTVRILNSVASACQSCGKVFNATFNPQTGQVEISILVPKVEG